MTGSVPGSALANRETNASPDSSRSYVLFAEDVRIHDWRVLRPGDRILIEELSGHQLVGVVDQVSGTGDVLWIRYSGLNSRRLLHAAEIAGITCRADQFEPPKLATLLTNSALSFLS